MSIERQPSASERNAEHQADLEQLAAKQLEALRHNAEASEQKTSSSERAEAAREAINRPELKSDKHLPDTETQPAAPKYSHPILTPAQNYQHTLESLRHHLKPVNRTFSKVIHHPAVESASAALESTVARPSILNGALWTAVVVGGTFYFVARIFGFQLAGSEMLFALIAGAIIGGLGEVIWRASRH